MAEPFAGGAWYEIGTYGERRDWGHVAAWKPPARLALVPRLTPEFTHDPALHAEVEVTFTSEGNGTRVRLAGSLRQRDLSAAILSHVRGTKPPLSSVRRG